MKTYLRVAVFGAFAAGFTLTAAARDTLDPGDPDEALLISNKLFCDNEEGKPSLYWWKGTMYSRIPGEKDRHLFDVHGMNIRACKKFEDPVKGIGFRSVSREAMFYIDPETGEVVNEWENPWTGEVVEVVHVANDPVNARRANWSRDKDGKGRINFDRYTMQDGIAMSGGGAARLFYENPLSGDYQDYVGHKYHATEFLTMAFPWEDAIDASKTAIQDAVISWGRISGWMPWMKMRGREGLVVFYTHGMRLHDWSELPDVIRNEIETNYPVYMSPPPLDDDRPNDTSWTVFKRYVDEKRARETAESEGAE